MKRPKSEECRGSKDRHPRHDSGDGLGWLEPAAYAETVFSSVEPVRGCCFRSLTRPLRVGRCSAAGEFAGLTAPQD